VKTVPLPRIRERAAGWALPALAALALHPRVSAGVALLAGVALALTLGNPWPSKTRALAHRALAWSVVGLGAGMDLTVVGRVGLHGVGYTLAGIVAALTFGRWLGRRLGVPSDTSLLITVGTAICGGSAIAAVAPSIGAKEEETSIALVTVFLLNAVALFVFPAVGHRVHLGQDAFGLWSALAIHDTSSVVGAASQYGERALQVATAAKLARALWIVPLTLLIDAQRRARKGGAPRAAAKRPWFILAFLAVAALVTVAPALRPAGQLVSAGAHRLLAVTLFLMGAGLSRAALRGLGVKPVVLGVTLWVVLATGTLGAVLLRWIA
jgi:uncharacterized integral membrane protein (TIGR00698 family)